MLLIVCKKWLRSGVVTRRWCVVRSGKINDNLQPMNNKSRLYEATLIRYRVENNNGFQLFGIEYIWCEGIIWDGICTEWTTNTDSIISVNITCPQCMDWVICSLSDRLLLQEVLAWVLNPLLWDPLFVCRYTCKEYYFSRGSRTNLSFSSRLWALLLFLICSIVLWAIIRTIQIMVVFLYCLEK